MLLTIIAGARPNFMKIAPLVDPLSAAGFVPRIVHTGQHYDRKMSQTFFDELGIPEPDTNLGVGSGSHIWQISEVMKRLESDYQEHRPGCVVVVGDVNSTMAATITANKLGIPVAHVEAGLRSFDREMPEENNRLVTDAISHWLFTSESSGNDNLIREGIPSQRIHFVGNVMIDTLLNHLDRARDLAHYESMGLEPGKFAVLTLHRPSNVDDPQRLKSILTAIHALSEDLPIVCPLHPRTAGRLEEFGYDGDPKLNGYTAVEPLGYLSMLSLIDKAAVVLTDSGGLQEETTAVGTPCITLRENTERPATITHGTNHLVGWKTEDILQAYQEIASQPRPVDRIPELWDGKASERIAAVLKDHLL